MTVRQMSDGHHSEHSHAMASRPVPRYRRTVVNAADERLAEQVTERPLRPVANRHADPAEFALMHIVRAEEEIIAPVHRDRRGCQIA